ncbi:hypothetical protein L195_g039381 [Trifolium pratense]|uniref:Uncharacterized protein n=2 Tax=Trifolium pratense TaxID=57577 RepID=A0A2K3LXS6_TRIPR|nr:hypothetical protein L195_g039381 [Trifolium pratense]CAJ2648699.1 unnamed protein product [Trifolium pratense]
MGLLENLEWVNVYGKKRCRSLFWRMRAAVKRALKNGNNQKLKFQYDPSSYALNFDDGCSYSHLRDTLPKKFIAEDAQVQYFKGIDNTTWVYVIWIKTK